MCNPSEKKQKEGASKSFLPGSASSALPRTLSGCFGVGDGVSSQQESRAKAKGAGCGLGRPLPPACPGADAGTAWIGQRRARLGTDGRALACAWRRGVAQPPRPEQLTADDSYLSVRPGVGRPQYSEWWGFGGLSHLHPPGSGRGSCPQGGYYPLSVSPCFRSAPRAVSGAGSSPPPTPSPTRRPGFSSRPVSPATFRALFSGWK